MTCRPSHCYGPRVIESDGRYSGCFWLLGVVRAWFVTPEVERHIPRFLSWGTMPAKNCNCYFSFFSSVFRNLANKVIKIWLAKI